MSVCARCGKQLWRSDYTDGQCACDSGSYADMDTSGIVEPEVKYIKFNGKVFRVEGIDLKVVEVDNA